MAGNSEEQPKRRRGPGKPFQPGQSGNPSGRSKADAEARAVLALKGKELAEKLLKLALEDENVFALKTALEHVLGKPHQSVDVTSQGKALRVVFNISRGGK